MRGDNCIACGAGKSVVGEGAGAEALCVACPRGKYSSKSDVACIECGAGR